MTYMRKEQLQELSGAKRRTRILDWLHRLGVKYIEDANGWPVVSEATILAKMGESTKREPRLNLG